MSEDIYVVVCENDQSHTVLGRTFVDDRGPLAFETYTDEASIETAREKITSMRGTYGKCRIAKLVFLDGESYE